MGPGEAEVIDRLVRCAGDAAQVRALLLTGSRANPDAPVDELSDYDVVVVVPDARAFDADETWFHEYGRPLVSFRDQRVRSGVETRTRLVVYEDGTKVDYQVWPVDLIQTLPTRTRLPPNLDLGYRVLLDRDGLTSHLPQPTYAAHIPARPTETEFLALVEEFWWETTYVAKNLWRDELLPASTPSTR